ncbi:hypothetical protein BDY24DRAFT_160953 [Mrakia frigida]|uniref:uncharacterized protein n=1 Tax=Mrakia frigida TaxID=29902 RepID=UPI003FCBFAF0
MQRGLLTTFPSIAPRLRFPLPATRTAAISSLSQTRRAQLFSARRSFCSSLPSRLSSSAPFFETTKPASGVSVDGTPIADRGERVVDLSDEGKEDGESEEDESGLVRGEDGVVRGRLSPTNSHLLRLTLPLPSPERPCAFVLHPTQPLSYVARLISAEMPLGSVGNVEFKGFGKSSDVRWSNETDIGDFVHQAARVKSFHIALTPPPSATSPSSPSPSIADSTSTDSLNLPITFEVLVPSFSARTHFLRARLRKINESLRELGDLKALCDKEARRGARRVALGGLGGLLAYWAIVAKLSFHPDVGWDVMEPVTYLIGHGALVGGYCYFLLHSREPGYGTVLDRSISTRQAKLYEKHGFDVDLHRSLTKEGFLVRDEIKSIAKEYGVDWSEKTKKEEVKEVMESERLEERSDREGKDQVEEDEKIKSEKKGQGKKKRRRDEGDD